MDDVRSLFDAYEPKTAKTFGFVLPARARRREFPSPQKERRTVENSDDDDEQQLTVVCLCAVSENPGALQSGVFLWPAALSLCEYLCANWRARFQTFRSFAELGAGSGLPGLLVCKLLLADTSSSSSSEEEEHENHNTTPSFLFTDREYACLKMIKESLALNRLDDGRVSIRTKRLLFEAESEALEKFRDVDVIIGSDLIYSTSVAHNLLRCLKRRFEGNRWFFLLVSSFRDPVTTRFIEDVCHNELGMSRTVEVEKDARGCLIEMYECA